MVVSSVTPLMPAAIRVKRCGSAASERPSSSRIDAGLLVDSAVAGSGTAPARLVLDAVVDQQRRVAAVVEDHVRAVGVGPG